MKTITLIAIIGKAGSGKDSLLKGYLSAESNPNLHKIIGCTTRPIRENEQDGVDYFFITHEQFVQNLIDGDLFSVTEFNDWSYGTRLSDLQEDKINIGIFNPSAVDLLYDYSLDPEAAIRVKLFIVYITAPDKDRLIRQLTREENPNVEEIIRRFQADANDFIDLPKYNLEINNSNKNGLTQSINILKQFVDSLDKGY